MGRMQYIAATYLCYQYEVWTINHFEFDMSDNWKNTNLAMTKWINIGWKQFQFLTVIKITLIGSPNSES